MRNALLRKLSRHEQAILNGMRRGEGKKEIAWALRTSVSTARYHAARLCAKLRIWGRQNLWRKYGFL